LCLLEPIKGDIIYQYPNELGYKMEKPLYSGLYSGRFKVIDVDGNLVGIFLGSVYQYRHYERGSDNNSIVKLPNVNTDRRSKRDWDIHASICTDSVIEF
jgi:hypothetical protein